MAVVVKFDSKLMLYFLGKFEAEKKNDEQN